MARRKRRMVWVVAVSVALIAVVGYFLIPRYFRVRSIPGIYLVEGGTGCVVIVREGPDTCRIERIYLDPGLAYQITSVWPKLRIDGALLQPASPTRMDGWNTALAPSRTRRGDWDAVGFAQTLALSALTPPTSLWEAIERHFRNLGQTSWLPLAQPLPYLHRLDDKRVVEYFDLQNAEKNPRAAVEKAQALLKAYPDDLHVRVLYLSAAERAGDFEEVRRRIGLWKSEFEKSGNPFLRWHARRFAIAGRNAYEFIEQLLSPDNDLAGRLGLFPKALEMEGYLAPRLPGLMIPTPPKFLERQVALKVCRVVAALGMLEGRREESLRLLASNYRLGQFMTGDTLLIDRLIGVAVKSIAAGGLEMYALNCCESEAEFKQLWEMLDVLEKGEKPDEVRAAMPIEYPFDLRQNRWVQPNLAEAQARADVSHSRFELVRMGTAAKYRLVFLGDFPKAKEQFSPLLPKELPKDPFGDGPMKFLTTSDSLICYSIGPDKTDDRGAITYDPTNGTLSAGDIFVTVPRQRQYPFPRGGVRATSLDDLKRQFPNGLPADPFATTRNRPLGTTITAEGDVYVFSYGPDVDEFKHAVSGAWTSSRDPSNPPPHTLECPYDPTNGTVSEGDLFIRIPRP